MYEITAEATTAEGEKLTHEENYVSLPSGDADFLEVAYDQRVEEIADYLSDLDDLIEDPN